MKIQVKVMKIKVEERDRNACYMIRSKLPFSVAKHRGSEMSVVQSWIYNYFYIHGPIQ